MKLLTLSSAARLTMLAGLVALGATAAITHTAPANLSAVRAMQIADGSESTGKPPKPHGRLTVQPTRAMQIADGSESTSKPPKPKNNA